MKKSIKRISVLLAMSLMAASISGCGSKSNGEIVEDMEKKYSDDVTFNVPYEGIEYVVTKTEITDEMVETNVNSFLSQYAESTNLTEGTTKSGDTVNIDYVGSVDGVEFEGGTTQGNGTNLTLGSGSYIDGFEEQVIGHDVGENFNIEVTFSENYGSEELNGKVAVFNITINYIVQTNMPELNDTFVQSNTSYENVALYKEAVKNDLIAKYESSDDNSNKMAIITAVISGATINQYPEAEIDELIDETITDVKNMAEQYGYEYMDFLTSVYGFSNEEEFNAYVKEVVMDYMNEKMVIVAIANKQKITVSDEEVDKFKTDLMESNGFTKDEELEVYYTQEDLVYYALAEKVMAYLMENGTPVEAAVVE